MTNLKTQKEAKNLKTQKEANELVTAPDARFMSPNDYWQMKEWETERKAELEAEGAWLRHAENLGWEEAWMESLVESGLRVRW